MHVFVLVLDATGSICVRAFLLMGLWMYACDDCIYAPATQFLLKRGRVGVMVMGVLSSIQKSSIILSLCKKYRTVCSQYVCRYIGNKNKKKFF